MGRIAIENLEDAMVERLKRRAAVKGLNVADEARRLLEQGLSGGSVVQHGRMMPRERHHLLRQAQGMTPAGVAQTDSADMIRKARDEGDAGR